MTDIEQWRPVPIPQFSHLYEVSNFGRGRSLDRAEQQMVGSGIRVVWSRPFKGKMLRGNANNRGYPSVYLRCAPLGRNVAVHRLVAGAFIPNPDDLPEVNHRDTNKTNNRDTNLEWISRVGNHTHAVEAGIMPFCNRKLSSDDVATIKQLASGQEFSYREIAKRFGVTQPTVSRIVNGSRRKHG